VSDNYTPTCMMSPQPKQRATTVSVLGASPYPTATKAFLMSRMFGEKGGSVPEMSLGERVDDRKPLQPSPS